MKLILHIGNHKTGSTTIQNNLLKYKNTLLNKFNILYPNTSLIRGAHHILPSVILGRKKIFSSSINISYDEIINLLKQEIKNYNPKIVFLSSEEFFIFNINQIKMLNKLFLLFDEIELVVYLRNQLDHIESSYKFTVLWKYSMEKNNFSTILKQSLSSDYHCYDKKLLNWKSIYPSLKITVKSFDEEIRKGFINNFFESVLNIKLNIKEEKNNASLTRFSTLILKSLNRLEIKGKKRERYILKLKEIEEKYPILKKESLYTKKKLYRVNNSF